MSAGGRTCWAALILCCLAVPGAAEYPFSTEEASTAGEGAYSISAGVRWQERERETRFLGGELLSWPAGTYRSVPEVEATLGVGRRAEVSLRYEYLFYDLEEGGSDTDSGDLRVWTKLGLLGEDRQNVSIRFGVKLPNSSEVGTNETDALFSGLYDLHWRSLRLSLNAGLAVLGNPAKNGSQDDMVTWAAALLWRGEAGARLGLEAAGMNGPFGVNRRRDHRTYAAVAGWGRGHWRFDTAVRYGVHQEEGWGWLAGLTYESL